jgi:hypothetical protein
MRQPCWKGCVGGWLPLGIRNNRIRIVEVREDLWAGVGRYSPSSKSRESDMRFP